MKVERKDSLSLVNDKQNFRSLKDMLLSSQCVTNTAVKERVAQILLEHKEETGTTMTMEEYINAEDLSRNEEKKRFNHLQALQHVPVLETTPQASPTIMSLLRLSLRNAVAVVPKLDRHMTKIYLSIPKISVVISSQGTFQSSEAAQKLPRQATVGEDVPRKPVMGKLASCGVITSIAGQHYFRRRPIMVRRHSDSLIYYDSEMKLSEQRLDSPLLPAGSLLVDFPTRQSISSKTNKGLQQIKSTLIDTELSSSDESDESETFFQKGTTSRRYSRMTNSRGGLKISWHRFPSKDDSFVACQSPPFEHSQETRLMSGLEYLAPGRRESILKMMGA